MALLPLKPCAYSGCPATIREGRYCSRHKTIASREYDKQHRCNYKQNYGWHWRKIRQLYVANHPLCERCLEAGQYIPVDEVHHILPVDKGGTHDDDNLISLCRSCHGKTRTPKVYTY